MPALYEIFTGEELKIAELIQRRRFQILVHSYLYYGLNTNLISDFQFDTWSHELVDLQETYPKIAEMVEFHSSFKEFDGSTGAFLPYSIPRVQNIANRLLGRPWSSKIIKPEIKLIEKPKVTNKNTARKRLF